MFTLNMLKAFYRRALSVDILVYIMLFSKKVAIHSCKFFFLLLFFFVNCVMVFFVFFCIFFLQNALF